MARSAAQPAVALVLLAAFLGSSPFATAARPETPVYQALVINPELTGSLLVSGSRALLVFGSDGTILRSEDGATWSHALTPGTADLARASANDNGSVIIAVGTGATILRSTDAGRTWNSAKVKVANTDLRAVVNQARSKTWVAAGTNGRIVRSIDDGKNWTVVESQLKTAFQALFLDPQTQAILIGGDDGLIGFSRDAGESWQITALTMPAPLTPVTAFHRFGKLLLATSALGRFLTSEDDAASWDLMQVSTKAFFTGCALDPLRGAIVMIGHNGDVLRSPDGGHTWEGGDIAFDGRKNFLSAIHFDERSGSLIVLDQAGRLARSTDGGAHWDKVSADIHGEVHGLIDDASRGRVIAFGTGGMIASSTDAGLNWSDARSSLDMSLRDIAATPRGDALVATSKLGDVIRSVDGGSSWRALTVAYPNPAAPPDLRGIVLAPSGEALIAVGPPGVILRSNADGSGWDVRHSSPTEAGREFPGVLVDRSRKNMVAIEAGGELRVSHDDGLQWQPVPVPGTSTDGPFWQGAVLERSGVMIIGGKAGTAARSDNGTQTFRRVATGTDQDLFGTFADETSGSLFLMGAAGTLLRSTDLGATWQGVASGSTNELRRMLRANLTLVCFGAHGTILRSQDQGLTWRLVPSGTDGALRQGMLEPRTGNALLVGSQGAILRSRDGGLSWEALPSHTKRHFSSMAADQRSGDLILVGERIVRLVRRFDGTIGSH
ncbi:MAG: YCF48-related protein [Pseudomonadota bacterium]